MPLAPSRFANQQWNLPSFGGAGGTPGVSLGYVPQKQVIGDPRNQAVLDAAKLGLPAAASAKTASQMPTDTQALAKMMAQMPYFQNQIIADADADWRKFHPDATVGFSRQMNPDTGKIATGWFEDKLLGRSALQGFVDKARGK